MFTAKAEEVLCSACNYDLHLLKRRKPDNIADQVPPRTGIRAEQ
jgi:hypothetical protein